MISKSAQSIRWGIAQNIELKWWQRYLKKKDIKEYIQWKKQYWYDFLETTEVDELLNDNSRILEVGCGPAGLFMVLEGQVTAIDPLLNSYTNKLSHLKPEQYPSVKFLEKSIEDFEEAEFDVVFCVNVINHVQDIEKSILRISQLLKSGGVLVISIDTHNHTILKKLFRLSQLDILHPHQFDLKEYEEMLKKYFEIQLVKRLQKRKIFDYHVIRCQKI